MNSLKVKTFSFVLITVILITVVLIVKPQVSNLNTEPFPTEEYLSAASLNRNVTFKARVISTLGNKNTVNSILVKTIETTTQEQLSVAVLIEDSLLPASFTPGQIYIFSCISERGNLKVKELQKM